MWSDPIADMLTRIRNACKRHSKEVKIPCSNLKTGIAEVLLREGYIRGYDRIDDGKQGWLRVELKYGPRGEDLIHFIRRESKSGRRVYVGAGEIPCVLDGLGIAVLSTSQGVLGDRICSERGIGGELLCTVY